MTEVRQQLLAPARGGYPQNFATRREKHMTSSRSRQIKHRTSNSCGVERRAAPKAVRFCVFVMLSTFCFHGEFLRISTRSPSYPPRGGRGWGGSVGGEWGDRMTEAHQHFCTLLVSSPASPNMTPSQNDLQQHQREAKSRNSRVPRGGKRSPDSESAHRELSKSGLDAKFAFFICSRCVMNFYGYQGPLVYNPPLPPELPPILDRVY
jgi:hypothetical protein